MQNQVIVFFSVNLWWTCAVLQKLTESRSLQIERNHLSLQDDLPLPPYYSFHETPGDIVHTLLTAFTPPLFLYYPYHSLWHLSPGGNTRAACARCANAGSWAAVGKPEGPVLLLAWFRLLPRGTEPLLAHQAALWALTPGCRALASLSWFNYRYARGQSHSSLTNTGLCSNTT